MSHKPTAHAASGAALAREFKVLNKFGIHARPAALFVKAAARFSAEITVEKDGMIVSGKSIMGLLTLEGYKGCKLRISATGPDAEKALAALEELFINNFYEE